MSENCDHNCSTCGKDCSSRSFLEPLNSKSTVKKVIGIVSGKGGVGKSFVSSALAVASARHGLATALMDADVTGPSIPQLFGIHSRAVGTEDELFPAETPTGIRIMSLNLLLPSETDPVVWRGPIISGMIKNFWKDVVWGDNDIMFIDMPPGTGDVPLTLFQSIPLDGIIVVTSPQDLVGMIVEKAVNMAGMMNIPVIGIVENMAYITCPDCGNIIYPFGSSKIEERAAKYGISHTVRIPIDPVFAELADRGEIEKLEGEWLESLFSFVQ